MDCRNEIKRWFNKNGRSTKRKIELDLNRETKLFYKKNKNKSIKSFRI